MANVEAFNEGFDRGLGRSSKKKDKGENTEPKPVHKVTTKGGMELSPSAPMKDYGQFSKSGSFKKGGRVKKTGLAKVHAGERVLTKKQAKKYKKKSSARKHSVKR